jgi:hypothetical protein
MDSHMYERAPCLSSRRAGSVVCGGSAAAAASGSAARRRCSGISIFADCRKERKRATMMRERRAAEKRDVKTAKTPGARLLSLHASQTQTGRPSRMASERRTAAS